jgi:RNA polymerase sigma-70 factor, ECF subfamily
MSGSPGELATLLALMRNGDADAAERVLDAVYAELRQIARSRMRREQPQHTLQPTALIHEAYLRLLHGPDVVHDRQHFLALAAQAMRRVLVDHARQKRSNKRGGGMERVTLEGVPGSEPYDVNVLALDQALEELATLDPRASRVVELKYFGGYTDKEVCDITGENLPRVRRDWVFARSWLKARFGDDA